MESPTNTVLTEESHLHKSILKDRARRERAKLSKYLLKPVRTIICFTNSIIKILMVKT